MVLSVLENKIRKEYPQGAVSFDAECDLLCVGIGSAGSYAALAAAIVAVYPNNVIAEEATFEVVQTYETEEEQEALHKKICCCANEFVHYIHEHRPDVVHASLTDAMECLGIAWDGIPHSSIADTYACKKVWERLFPNYYED